MENLTLLIVSHAAGILLLVAALLQERARAARTLRTLASAAAVIATDEPWRRLPHGEAGGDVAAALNEIAFRVERELARTRAEKNRLNGILRGMGEGVMVVDPAGTVTLVNPALRALFSPVSDLEGRRLIDVSRHPGLNDTFRQVMAAGAERFEELELNGGGGRIVLTHWVPLAGADSPEGTVVVFHDITEIRRLENIRKDFVANVSHELRTPITIIKGYAETLAAGGLENPVQAARFVSIIVAHAERLAALVGDLLTLSQIESGNASLQVKSVRADAVAGRVVSLLEQKSQQKRIRVDASGLAGAPPVLADPGRLEQVLVNLLDNAIKYTPAGGEVTFSAACEGNQVRIGVHDTGIGISSRDLPRIFERFYRVDTGRSRDEGGTGLGLSIVKHLVQMQGGTVSVDSCGKGSSFFVTLKRALTLSGEVRALHEDLSPLQQSRDVCAR